MNIWSINLIIWYVQWRLYILLCSWPYLSYYFTRLPCFRLIALDKRRLDLPQKFPYILLGQTVADCITGLGAIFSRQIGIQVIYIFYIYTGNLYIIYTIYIQVSNIIWRICYTLLYQLARYRQLLLSISAIAFKRELS